VPFGLGRPVRSTLTLLILVPVLSPAPHAYTSSLALSPPWKDRRHAEGGRIHYRCDPLRTGFSLGALLSARAS